MPEQLSGLLIHVTGTPSWLLRLVKVSNSSELYPDCFRLPAFLDCSGIQFFDSPPFSQHSHLDHLRYLSLTVQYLCDLGDPMPRQWSPGTSHPTLA